MFCPCFVVSILVLQSSHWGTGCSTFLDVMLLLSFMPLPHGAVGYLCCKIVAFLVILACFLVFYL